MTNYYFPIIYIVPLISIDGQASPRLFIAPEIRHEKISYLYRSITYTCTYPLRHIQYLSIYIGVLHMHVHIPQDISSILSIYTGVLHIHVHIP